MKIALFGGAFDPPHLGHQRIAKEMVNHQLVDEVWFVPVFRHPWADRLDKLQMADYEHRKEMVKLILTPGTFLHEYLDVGFAYKTLQYFAKRYPQHQFSWIIGADNLPTFDDWEYYQEIIDEFGVYVYPREGFELKTDIKGMKLLSDFPEMVVSSTMVKKKLLAGGSISDLVSPAVAGYIESNNLYQK